MNNRLYGNLIFELSCEGRKGYSLPKNAFGDYDFICQYQFLNIIKDELTKCV